MIIKIPFNDRFIMPIARGQKIYTTRTKRYGNPNDYFYVAEGRKIKCILTGITRVRLQDVMYKYYWQEGFDTPAEFKKFWLIIHRKWQPEKYFWLHSFRRI